MPALPSYGKITKNFFDSVIYPKLGARRSEVIIGPSPGVDVCVIKTDRKQVLVATVDPLSFIPELGAADSAWVSVNLIASDLATSGFHPQYAILNFNLPPSMPTEEFATYWTALSDECARLGIAIVGGHTGKFEGCNYTIIGAGMMFSMGSASAYLTSKGATAGDKVILTKGAAIATTGILARVFPKTVSDCIGEEGKQKASKYFRQTSVVEDALDAASIGVREEGVTAMHDATEGGVLSALYELAAASSLGLVVDKQKIPLSPETVSICELFNIDPYISLSEGSLVIASVPSKTNDIIRVLESKGIRAAIVGELTKPELGIRVKDNGVETPIKHPVVDPYWQAFYKAKKANWH